MAQVQLVKHKLEYSERIYELSSAPQVKDALALPDGTVADTKRFIASILQEEDEGKTVSRLILDEEQRVIGITTLMFIDRENKSCHIGTWIGHEYWGKGYNQVSKVAMLRIAFQELGLQYVFAGARKTNTRSQKAQEKLPFIKLHVEEEFPEEHLALEKKEQQPCVLHVFKKEDFQQYF
ncbi:GNAT family N-acetyltransferase [Pseudalkalibacillus sp. SCS-8]|uniref:GNAT family N-acetyltransferase n=1 Tax=Pseudalkalibacillus nanhaiensis TaxID=3115291 RepID=UPI0032DA79AE